MDLIGHFHSVESFGTVDGPGIRFVAFMQGCPLRCLFCHNPDTWRVGESSYQYTPRQLLEETLRYRSFIQKGGVTLSGGEPLLQAAFVEEYFRLCKKENLHTALDTSGAIFSDAVLRALNQTDLTLLDIKAATDSLCKKLTGSGNANALKILDYLQEKNKPVWVRHVVVPGYTDDDEQLSKLAKLLSAYSVVQRVEVLPYHTMGIHKYAEMNIPYALRDIPALSAERTKNAERILGVKK